MSPEQTNIDADDEHSLATEPEEQAHLEDVIPEPSGDIEEEAESIEQQLEKAQATIRDYWDQMMRLRAEIENNRKRAERDLENAHKYALKNFAEELLPVIDSMEMGQVAAQSENATLQGITEGSALTMNMFVQVLEKNGLQQIDPVGEKFDPEKHQAISMVEAQDAESNTIIEVMQKGFLLNDRLVRPAMVVVAK
ncbi:MAG: nucleotide exchange factor GrpE [Gammaproteobacteria bacterium]|nr:nucleotide exchange factor GrpE [Gammaproteobacteria bacterium]MDH3537357.1 nucleotide exchange factor GrpE [Gammaproteobacteria bacterium]